MNSTSEICLRSHQTHNRVGGCCFWVAAMDIHPGYNQPHNRGDCHYSRVNSASDIRLRSHRTHNRAGGWRRRCATCAKRLVTKQWEVLLTSGVRRRCGGKRGKSKTIVLRGIRLGRCGGCRWKERKGRVAYTQPSQAGTNNLKQTTNAITVLSVADPIRCAAFAATEPEVIPFRHLLAYSGCKYIRHLKIHKFSLKSK